MIHCTISERVSERVDWSSRGSVKYFTVSLSQTTKFQRHRVYDTFHKVNCARELEPGKITGVCVQLKLSRR